MGVNPITRYSELEQLFAAPSRFDYSLRSFASFTKRQFQKLTLLTPLDGGFNKSIQIAI